MSLRAFAIGLAALAACTPGTPPATPAPVPSAAGLTQELTAQFTRSAAAWNGGDLDLFVSDYAPDSATSFVDGRRARHGFTYIKSIYAPRFAPGATRDSLRFEELEARPLGASFALVTARFVLFRGGQTTASGPFTLVMEQRPDGWKILHDHTSSDPK